jgi:hypothetical protein
MFSATKLVDPNVCELGLELAGVGERYEKPNTVILQRRIWLIVCVLLSDG